MSDLYVDSFYWEFGYAVGDQDLGALEADPVVTATSAQGGLGTIQSLSAQSRPGDGAFLNSFELNTAAPAELPEQVPAATVSGLLDVRRFVFVSGGFVVEASCAAALGITVNAVAAVQATVVTSAELDLQVPLDSVDAQCVASVDADLRQTVNLAAGVSVEATVAAAAAVSKLFVADANSAVHTSAVALLGKRLAGSLSASAAAVAAVAIQKAMGSSVAALAVTSATAQVDKPIAAAALGAAEASAVAAVNKPVTGAAEISASTTGRTVLLRFVPVEIAYKSSAEVVYSLIYADAQLIDDDMAVTQADAFAEVSNAGVLLQLSYVDARVDAELIDSPELEVTW